MKIKCDAESLAFIFISCSRIQIILLNFPLNANIRIKFFSSKTLDFMWNRHLEVGPRPSRDQRRNEWQNVFCCSPRNEVV